MTMKQIDEFCEHHHILQSNGSDSYFFTIRGKPYVVSNRKREVPEDTSFILASKIRIREIYEDLMQGRDLDHRGRKKMPEAPNTSVDTGSSRHHQYRSIN